MSYLGMSVKEAVNHVSANVNGWFLPAVQRPYVWGSRYESESYICKLFDSILRGYPIGGLIVWNNPSEMQYREFLRDYSPGVLPSFVEKGLWARQDKWLVYDGQQRLQTLYSCLKYSINGKVLTFDLSFQASDDEPDDTGFAFFPINDEIPGHVIRMNEVFVKPEDGKFQFRNLIIKRVAAQFHSAELETIEKNIDALWDVFVRNEKKSIAYFPVSSPDERTVNEIFQRLNTGGVPLSQSDLLLSKIKEQKYDFEEDLQLFSQEIYQKTGNGYIFETDHMLQLLNLVIRGGIRIAPEKTSKEEIDRFIFEWPSMKNALTEFFSNFMWGAFKINNRSIIPRQLAIFPMIIFFKVADEKKINFRRLDYTILQSLKKFFILSQVNDWNLQTTIDRFSRMILKSNSESKELIFPLQDFIDYFDDSKQRNVELYEEVFTGYEWFALKVLMPGRVFLFEPDSRGRYNPEIDHIFPSKLPGQTEEYVKGVDIIWNKQAVKGEVNNYKRRRHPVEFFEAEDGGKYFSDYDFLKPLTDSEWKDWKKFLANRRLRMLESFKSMYNIELIES